MGQNIKSLAVDTPRWRNSRNNAIAWSFPMVE